jgi:peptide-methionine (R)-S-oxide reductase
MHLLCLLLVFSLASAEFELTDSQWKERLGGERYNVMRRKTTEPAYSGLYLNEDREGIYLCAGCGASLFASQDKYKEPGCGWPLFKQPIEPKSVFYLEDRSLGFKRYEVLCRRCESHLGHVFNDGPPPKHRRYTINSLALLFVRPK